MTAIESVAALTELGRVHLSEHFFMRDISISSVEYGQVRKTSRYA